jgi:hypothetical protein
MKTYQRLDCRRAAQLYLTIKNVAKEYAFCSEFCL